MYKHLYEIFKHWYCVDGIHQNSIYLIGDPHFSDLESYKLRFPEEFKLRDISEHFKDSFCKDTMPRELLGEPITDEDIVKELDQMQIDNINKVVHKNDTLIILGDVGNIECVKKLKAGYKVLIMGNHDKGASNYKRKQEVVSVDNIPIDLYKGKDIEVDTEGIRTTILDNKSSIKFEDNHLFDEVYEGTLQIGPKILLSHEPIPCDYALNIHGHCHDISGMFNDKYHLNMCAEWIDYKPQNLAGIIKHGYLKEIDDIHRQTIDRATLRKEQKMHEITAEISYIDAAGNYGSYTYTYEEPDDVCIYTLSYSEMKRIFEYTALPNEKLIKLMKGK